MAAAPHLSRSIAFRIPFLVGAVFALAATFVAIDAGLYVGQDQHEVVAEAQGPTASDLVAEHGCWTGEAPADMQGVFPGHVVVSVNGSPRIGGERLVGKALEQVFDGVDHGLLVHGFCR